MNPAYVDNKSWDAMEAFGNHVEDSNKVMLFFKKHDHWGFEFKLLKGFEGFDDTNVDLSIKPTYDYNQYIINVGDQNKFAVWNMKPVTPKNDPTISAFLKSHNDTSMVAEVEVIVDGSKHTITTTNRARKPHPAARGIVQHAAHKMLKPVLRTLRIQILHKPSQSAGRKAAKAPKKA